MGEAGGPGLMGSVADYLIRGGAPKNFFERNPRKTLVLFIIIFLVSLEVVGHLIYYFTHQRTFIFHKTDFVEFSPYGFVHYKPNTTILLPGYPAHLETDQYGYVHNGYKKEIGPEQYLIFLVGGSAAEGRGSSSNAATMAACLERVLNQRAGGERFRVVNAGMSGFVTYQELSLLQGEIIPKFKPRLVVALDGHNDGWCAVSFAEWRPNWQPYFDQLTRDVNRNMEPGFGILIDLTKRHSIIAATFEKLRKRFVPKKVGSFSQKTKPPEARLEAAARGYVVNQQIIRELLNLHGARYQAFLQPFLASYLKREMQPEEVKFLQAWGAEYPEGDIYYQGMEIFYNKLSKEAGSLGFFNDFSKLFMETPETTYVDHCHFNDAGNKMIAEAMAQKLWPELTDVK